jgi:hypothetical protein
MEEGVLGVDLDADDKELIDYGEVEIDSENENEA